MNARRRVLVAIVIGLAIAFGVAAGAIAYRSVSADIDACRKRTCPNGQTALWMADQCVCLTVPR